MGGGSWRGGEGREKEEENAMWSDGPTSVARFNPSTLEDRCVDLFIESGLIHFCPSSSPPPPHLLLRPPRFSLSGTKRAGGRGGAFDAFAVRNAID